jgi:hypothetical protein
MSGNKNNYTDAIAYASSNISKEDNYEIKDLREENRNLHINIKYLKIYNNKLIKDKRKKNTELARREKIIIELQRQIE